MLNRRSKAAKAIQIKIFVWQLTGQLQLVCNMHIYTASAICNIQNTILLVETRLVKCGAHSLLL